MRHPETYEHIRPEQVGNRRRVLISELSGGSNVLYKSQEYDLDIDEQGMRRIVETIKDLEYQGYSFEGAEGSFELMLKKSLGLHERFFDFEGFRLIIEKKEANGEPVAEASIKLRVQDRVLHTVAEGNGPVNALDKALRKLWKKSIPTCGIFTCRTTRSGSSTKRPAPELRSGSSSNPRMAVLPGAALGFLPTSSRPVGKPWWTVSSMG